jgi:hypothetical protein
MKIFIVERSYSGTADCPIVSFNSGTDNVELNTVLICFHENILRLHKTFLKLISGTSSII